MNMTETRDKMQQQATQYEILERTAKSLLGAKLHQDGGRPSGEVVDICSDGLTIVVRTAGVERKVSAQTVLQYERDGKIRIERV